MTVISKDEFIEIVGIAVDSILENEQYFCDLDSVAGDGFWSFFGERLL